MSFFGSLPKDLLHSVGLYLEYPDLSLNFNNLSEDFWKIYWTTHYSKSLYKDDIQNRIKEIYEKLKKFDVNETFAYAIKHGYEYLVYKSIANGANVQKDHIRKCTSKKTNLIIF